MHQKHERNGGRSCGQRSRKGDADLVMPQHRHGKRFRGEELQLMVLAILEGSGPHHGYELIGKFSERSGEIYSPSPGVLYPLLTWLTEMDLIEEVGNSGSKRSYRIVDAGRAVIESRHEEVDAAFRRLDAMATIAMRTDAGPVKRAMVNLRTAVIQRLAATDVEKDLTFAVAEILDEAAQRIERL